MQQPSPFGDPRAQFFAAAKPHAGRTKRAADSGSGWAGSTRFYVFPGAQGFCRDRSITILGQTAGAGDAIGQSASRRYGFRQIRQGRPIALRPSAELPSQQAMNGKQRR